MNGSGRHRNALSSLVPRLRAALQAGALLMLALPWTMPALAGSDQEIEAFVDETVTRLMKEGNVPGVVVAVARGDRVLFSKGYGFRDRELHLPVEPGQTLFRVASITKLMTTMAVLSLVDEGVLDLDTDVNEYLSTVIVPPTFPAPVTVRHLLTHMGGFVGTTSYVHFGSDADTDMSRASMQRLLRRVRPPDELRAYDNTGFGLLGMIVADATGRPFRDIVADRVFRPLGMNDTMIGLPEREAGRASQGHTIDIERAGHLPVTPQAHLGRLVEAAGAASSTGEDMGRFLVALMDGTRHAGGRVLGEATYRDMLDTSRGRGHPMVPGLGYAVYETDFQGRRAFGHGGLIDGFVSELLVFPDADLGLFVSSNVGIVSPPIDLGIILTQMRLSPDVIESAGKAMGVSRGLAGAFAERFVPVADDWGGSLDWQRAGGMPAFFEPVRLSGWYRSGAAEAGLTFGARFFLQAFGGMEVQGRENGRLEIFGRELEQLAPGYFADSERERVYAFRADDGRILQVATPIGWSEKVSRLHGPAFTVLPLLGGLVFLLSAGLYWLPAGRRVPRLRRLGRTYFVAGVLVVVGLVLELQYAEFFIYGRDATWVPLAWRLPLHVVLLALLLSPVALITVRRQQAAASGWRTGLIWAHLVLLSVAGLMVFLTAAYWRLFGNLSA